MGWLKRVGQIALQVTTGLQVFGPMIKTYTPDHIDRVIDIATTDAEEFQKIIVQMETIGLALNLTGEQKLQAITAAAGQIVLHSAIMANKEVEDPELFKTGIQNITTGYVQVLNACKAPKESDVTI